MKKSYTALLLVLTLCLSPALQANRDQSNIPTENSSEMPMTDGSEDWVPSESDDSEGAPVTSAAEVNKTRRSNSKRWQSIALAIAAVAVAVAAMLIVASNDGHHSKS
ncbi:MAG: hypothetical protein JSS61_04900 [Verrucomicrobia bacterium]|nr:hypothetical protein [Verrucomicrobiota bacterium]